VKRVTVLALLVALYAGLASGVKPFTSLAYVLVAIPSLTALVMYVLLGGLTPHRDDVTNYYLERSGGATLINVVPWLSLLALAVGLEVVGLALGGRSNSVPTLSTTVDHLLVTREGRWLLYATWLSVGIAPLLRLWQRQRTARS
jgi:hypothetical protein